MIIRIWHGYTKPEHAESYQQLLYDEIFPGIVAKKVKGYRGIELLRRELDDEVEFITIMRFDELHDVIRREDERGRLSSIRPAL